MKAFYVGYHRYGSARVHITRETSGTWKQSGKTRRTLPGDPWCNTGRGPYTIGNEQPVVSVDPHKPLDPGLYWCGRCVGLALEHAGLLNEAINVLVYLAPGSKRKR